MRWLALLLLATTAFAQVPASRRYAEPTLAQMSFGPYKAVQPFNQQPGRLTATDGQLFPIVFDNNTFTSTGSLTVLQQTSPVATISVASNVLTIVTGSGGSQNYVVGSNGSVSPSAPSLMDGITVVTNGSGQVSMSETNTSGSVQIIGGYNGSGGVYITINLAGTYHDVYNGTGSLPSAPWKLAMSMVGSDVCLWENTGSTWNLWGSGIPCADISSFYNPQTVGNLSGFYSSIRLNTSSSTTWQFSNWRTSAFGAVGVRDNRNMTYSDGRPITRGSVQYFTATSCDPNAWCYDGVYSIDRAAGTPTVTEIAEIWNTRSGSVIGDDASQLSFSPDETKYYYLVGGWGFNPTGASTYGGEWTVVSADILSGGVFVVTATTQITTFQNTLDWDAGFICTAFNYSARSCPSWLADYAAAATSTQPTISTSTSDPTTDNWTGAVTDAANPNCEGARILRTATGSTGITIRNQFACQSTNEVKNFPSYTQTLTGQTFIPSAVPGNATSPGHPQITAYGNTDYLDSTSGAQWGANIGTRGQWIEATYPKYTTPINWPTFADGYLKWSQSGPGSITTATTSSMSVTTGQIHAFFCGAADGTLSSITGSTSLSMGTLLHTTLQNYSVGGNTGSGILYYVISTATGTTTDTCTFSASTVFGSVTPVLFNPGFLTAVDTSGNDIQTASNGLYTSATFSTSAKGLIIYCTMAMFTNTGYNPGTIGPFASGQAVSPPNGGAPMCETSLTDAAQTNITATMYTFTTAGTQPVMAAWVAFK